MNEIAIGIFGAIFIIAFIVAYVLAEVLPNNRHKPDPPEVSKWNK